MKRFLLILCCFIFLISAVPVSAITIDATITADNFYALYYGSEDGSTLEYVGRNESGRTGDPGAYNWSQAEEWNFNADGGDYIYVVAWSDGGTAQALLGEFSIGGSALYTNATDWEVYMTNAGAYQPTLPQLTSQLGTAATTAGSWDTITNTLNHGVSPWGTISGISSDADWIWGSTIIGGSNEGEYQVFRTQVNAPVPEPATMMLFGIGLLGLAGVSRRKK